MHFSMKNGSVIRNKYSTGRKRIKVNVFSYRESVQLFLAFSSHPVNVANIENITTPATNINPFSFIFSPLSF